jgi:hypothetical protein
MKISEDSLKLAKLLTTASNEHSGCMESAGDFLVITSVSQQVENQSDTPDCEYTFHTHTMKPNAKGSPYTSTDLPSAEDIYRVIWDTFNRGLKFHVIFTPNFCHFIKADKKTSPRPTNDLLDSISAGYKSCVTKMGKNYGPEFNDIWLAYVKRIPGVSVCTIRSDSATNGSIPQSWLKIRKSNKDTVTIIIFFVLLILFILAQLT